LENCSSPFLAWANTPIINWGYLFVEGDPLEREKTLDILKIALQ
jgi:hypothetical protein